MSSAKWRPFCTGEDELRIEAATRKSFGNYYYRKISNISRTKSQNLNASRLIL